MGASGSKSKFCTFLKSKRFQHRRILCPAARSLCTFSNILRPWQYSQANNIGFLNDPYLILIPIPSYLTVCYLQSSTQPEAKFRSPPKDSIMQLSISFIALAVGKDFAFSICSSIILRSKPLLSSGYETKQEFQSLVSTCEFFERKTETDSDFGGDTVIHLEM